MPCWFAGGVPGEWFGVGWGRAGEGCGTWHAVFLGRDSGGALGVGVGWGADIDPHQPVARGNKRPFTDIHIVPPEAVIWREFSPKWESGFMRPLHRES